MKVLVIAPSRHTKGGITSVVLAHEASLSWRDNGIVWIPTHYDGWALGKILIAVKALFSFLIKVGGADIAHIHFSEPVSAIRKLPFFVLSRVFNVKIVAHFHAFSPDSTIHGRLSFMYRLIFSLSDKIIVLSPSWRRNLLNACPWLERKVVVIWNPSPLAPSVVGDSNPTMGYILFLGKLGLRKGTFDLIRAFKLYRSMGGTLNLVLAGDGDIEEARSIASDEGVGQWVLTPGWVGGEAKDALLRSATIFCLPSYAEGFPMSVIEALFYGIPVVTTPVGGMPDALSHRVSVYFVTPGKIDEIANSLYELESNESLAEGIIQGGLKVSSCFFSRESFVKSIDGVYSDVSML